MKNMKNLIQTLCFLLSIIFSFGCSNMKNKPLAVNILRNSDSCLVLHNWHVIGPFKQSEKGDMLNFDNLTIFGNNENSIEYGDFSKISYKDLKKEYGLDSTFRCITGNNPEDVLNINLVFGAVEAKDAICNANAYLGCIIRADEESEYYLNFSSDNGAKVWLNNELIFNCDKEVSVFAYENYIPIKIKKGDNFLLVKVFNSTSDWLMYSKIEKKTKKGLMQHQKIQTLLFNRNFLKNSFLDTCSYLEFNDNFPLGNYYLSVMKDDSLTVYYDSLGLDNRNVKLSLQDGLYTVKLEINSDTLVQFIYKGDIIKNIQSLIEKEKLKLNINDRNDLNANIARFHHLMKPQNRGSNLSEKLSWQRKIIYLYRDISLICDESKKSLIDAPGFHVRTYVSEIDNQPQYFIIHIPRDFDIQKKYPVVFQIPYKVGSNFHYLESMRVADMQLIENLQDVADNNDIIIVEPFAREVGIPNFNGIEVADFFEVLNTICLDYKVDMNRIYFIGSCQGAHKALKIAVKYPDMLAGMAFISPLFQDPYGYRFKNEWIENGEPLNYISNIQNIPLLIIHSSKDGHMPVESSDNFAQYCVLKGMDNLEYRRLDDVIDQYYWSQYSDDLVKFLLKYKKVNTPKKVSISSAQLKGSKAYWLEILQFGRKGTANLSAEIDVNNEVNIISKNVTSFSVNLEKLPYDNDKEITINENGVSVFKGIPKKSILTFNNELNRKIILKTSKIEGPFCDAFTHKFIIVVGTKGTLEENVRLKELGDTLVAMWNYKYWNGCAIKNDDDISNYDIIESNLILLGNEKSNSIIGKIKDELPLTIDRNGVVISENKVEGENLGFYMVYPNPLNKNRYAALIGYNNSDYISLGSVDLDKENYKGYSDWLKLKYMEISCYGWCDFKVWDNRDNSELLRGYFNSYWE
ncbi:MAG: hypothetical protein JXB49_30385 [Bacteroidales bacterium]|nr:hypothetical protein [Bacteroidales bacterium]